MKILALSGGVGGAKLALGLSKVMAVDELLIAVNTGDDFEHLGLSISPDLDTLTYTLAGINETSQGWGLAGETWNTMSALEQLGGETWFRLGDKDLATHLERTYRLSQGQTLSEVTEVLCQRLGVQHRIVPMTDDPVRTVLTVADDSNAGKTISFQDYFVRDQCQHQITAIKFENARQARPNPEFMELLEDQELTAVVICPSNPFLSIDPILSLPAVRKQLKRTSLPVIGVSPIIGGDAIKGPTAQIMRDFGMQCCATDVARYYADILDVFVLDARDCSLRDPIVDLGLSVMCTNTLMETLEDKIQLAKDILAQYRDSAMQNSSDKAT